MRLLVVALEMVEGGEGRRGGWALVGVVEGGAWGVMVGAWGMVVGVAG